MMRFSLSQFISVISIAFCTNAFAVDDISTPETYKVSMQKIELCTSSACSDTTTLAETSATFNIASRDAGAAVGTWIENFALEVGKTYSHARATISTTMVIGGYTTNSSISSSYCVTSSSPTTDAAHTAAPITTGSNATTSAEMDWVVPNMLDADNGAFYGDLTSDYSTNGINKTNGATSFTWIGALATPYTPKVTSAPKITLSFDVANALRSQQAAVNSCFMYVLPPSVSISLTE